MFESENRGRAVIGEGNRLEAWYFREEILRWHRRYPIHLIGVRWRIGRRPWLDSAPQVPGRNKARI